MSSTRSRPPSCLLGWCGWLKKAGCATTGYTYVVGSRASPEAQCKPFSGACVSAVTCNPDHGLMQPFLAWQTCDLAYACWSSPVEKDRRSLFL